MTNQLKWVPWASAPMVYIDLKRGKKTVVTIRRMQGKGNKWGRKWQVVRKWVPTSLLPGTVGPVFPSKAAAMRFVEGRVR